MSHDDTSQVVPVEHIDELDRAQQACNNGRGIRCVRSILHYLRQGDIESAKTVRVTEGDKTRQYPEVEFLLLDIFGCSLHNDHDCEACSWYTSTTLDNYTKFLARSSK